MLPDASFDLLVRGNGFSQKWYDMLPAVYRDLDVRGQQLLRYLSLLGDQADEVQQIAEDVEDGQLTDPLRVPNALVPWLAQLLGITTPNPVPVDEMRERINAPDSIWTGGTAAAIAAIVAPLLTGDRWVVVLPHAGVAGGDPWTIGVFVRDSEAPVPLSDLTDAIIAAGGKPAGFDLTVTTVTVTWDDIESLGPTWDDLEGAGATWNELENASW